MFVLEKKDMYQFLKKNFILMKKVTGFHDVIIKKIDDEHYPEKSNCFQEKFFAFCRSTKEHKFVQEDVFRK